jgi:hypothetical protein
MMITETRDRLPVFRFSKAENWFPVGVEESLKLHGYRWEGDKFYKSYTGGPVERLNFPDDMTQPNLKPVVYHRVISGGGLAWHQYWLWYLYNPWGVGGVGKHEGDWEMVQIGVTPERRSAPILMTCSQHHNGGKREYWSVEIDEEDPVVYVALGSHANYFAPGRQGGGIDLCDGRGMELTDYELRDFGDWAEWPGRWGNSMGEGKSPESPGCQTIRWKKPHLYHSNSS